MVDSIRLHDVELEEIPIYSVQEAKCGLKAFLQSIVDIEQEFVCRLSRLPGIDVDSITHYLQILSHFFGIGNLIDICTKKARDQDSINPSWRIGSRDVDHDHSLAVSAQPFPKGLGAQMG